MTYKFQPGNKLWQLRKFTGRRTKYEGPEQLWNACVEYFEWVEANPLLEAKTTFHNGKMCQGDINKQRAMTLQGLVVHIGITQETWGQYAKRDDLSDVVNLVNDIIFEQKFTGASAGLLNPNIIARDLGLADKKDIVSTDKSLTPWSEISCDNNEA